MLPKPDPAGRTALRLSAIEFLDDLDRSPEFDPSDFHE